MCTSKRNKIELYERPDLAPAMLQELLNAAQNRDEPLETFGDRVRELVDLPHPKMPSNDKERTAIGAFCRGLFDKQLSQYVSVSQEKTLSGAVRVAATAGVFARIPVKAGNDPKRGHDRD